MCPAGNPSELYRLIDQASFRVDIVDKPLSGRGTAFAVSERELVTAAHVVEKSGGRVIIRGNSGTSSICKVTRTDTDADIAIIETVESPKTSCILPIDADCPAIGTRCLWGGYARFPGEATPDRIRFGHGLVASSVYQKNGRYYFDVDGNFNPSHSGSALVDAVSGKVIGVVIRSAGTLSKELKRNKARLMALEYVLAGVDTPMSETQFIFQKTQPEDDEILRVLEDAGLAWCEIEPLYGPKTGITVAGNAGDAIRASLRIITEMGQSIEEAVENSYQMGVGICLSAEHILSLVSGNK